MKFLKLLCMGLLLLAGSAMYASQNNKPEFDADGDNGAGVFNPLERLAVLARDIKYTTPEASSGEESDESISDDYKSTTDEWSDLEDDSDNDSDAEEVEDNHVSKKAPYKEQLNLLASKGVDQVQKHPIIVGGAIASAAYLALRNNTQVKAKLKKVTEQTQKKIQDLQQTYKDSLAKPISQSWKKMQEQELSQGDILKFGIVSATLYGLYQAKDIIAQKSKGFSSYLFNKPLSYMLTGGTLGGIIASLYLTYTKKRAIDSKKSYEQFVMSLNTKEIFDKIEKILPDFVSIISSPSDLEKLSNNTLFLDLLSDKQRTAFAVWLKAYRS